MIESDDWYLVATTALTWVLEIGDSGRFAAIREAVSYCCLQKRRKHKIGSCKKHRFAELKIFPPGGLGPEGQGKSPFSP
ncbi:MAG: hypothetical protein WA133_08985 [Syntrophales bacterium]